MSDEIEEQAEGWHNQKRAIGAGAGTVGIVALIGVFVYIFPLKADVLTKVESKEQRAELVARIEKVEVKLDEHLEVDAKDKEVMKDNLYNICLAVAKSPVKDCKR